MNDNGYAQTRQQRIDQKLEDLYLDHSRVMDAVFQTEAGEEAMVGFSEMEFPPIAFLPEYQKNAILRSAYKIAEVIDYELREQASEIIDDEIAGGL